MSTASDFRVLPNDEPQRISRRELARTLLTGLAAGILSPLSSEAHPVRKHLLNTALLDFADIHLSGETLRPLFLSAQQLHALDVLSEAIVPGSRKAQSAPFIDLLLSADAPDVRQSFLESFSAIQSASLRDFRAEVTALTESQLHDLLTAVSADHSPEQKHFNKLKEWIAGAYYSSEIGLRELGWNPDRVFASFPGCSHPDGHA